MTEKDICLQVSLDITKEEANNPIKVEARVKGALYYLEKSLRAKIEEIAD